MNKVAIKLHGCLGEAIGPAWNLAVSSVSEALRAIEVLSQRRFFKFLFDNDKKGVRYRVLINGSDFETDKRLDVKDVEGIKNSELCLNLPSLREIDIIPVIEGADSNILTIVLGAILVIVGIVLIFTGPGGGWLVVYGAMIIAGLGLIAAGVTNLLSSPPKFEDFRKIGGGGRTSYLFSGPENVIGEGGPVPVGYGRLLVGSQVISASYEVVHQNAQDNPLTF